MKQPPRFDIDLDKHYNATVVIACNECGHESRLDLKSMTPDKAVRCLCGAHIDLTPGAIMKAQQRVNQIKQAYHV
jgi:RNase P subunit RPR2